VLFTTNDARANTSDRVKNFRLGKLFVIMLSLIVFIKNRLKNTSSGAKQGVGLTFSGGVGIKKIISRIGGGIPG
jgi:hypothetical protein